MKHIELFAGCGGMTLGLEAAGFHLYFANELSPMASETFAKNILQEDLKVLQEKKQEASKTVWIKSNYTSNDLQNRLRENPFTYDNGKYSDLTKSIDLENKLLVGNIDHLLAFLAKNRSICKKLRTADIDLVSGGPPCQSFSLAGRREKDNKKNLLPLSFARFAGIVQPKMILLENVKGITSPFKVGGTQYHAWVEVAKAFCLEGFVPVCMMLNSKYFGVPQNRPRFILLALRKNICDQLIKVVKDANTLEILNSAISFYKLVIKKRLTLNEISVKQLTLYDIEKCASLFDGKLLPQIITTKDSFISASSAIGDLSLNASLSKSKKSQYVIELNELFSTISGKKSPELNNHEVRHHSFNVKARFRWLQVISNLNGLTPHALKLLSGQYTDEAKMKSVFEKVKDTEVLVKNGDEEELVKISNIEEFEKYIKSIQTRKHSQRAIRSSEPAPAQLTIPDDLCHYSADELRTLTVREMARFQSFPDWFEFRSKVTTGGEQRSFEVPQYTQVGNAVPPLLAFSLGKVLKELLNKIYNDKKD